MPARFHFLVYMFMYTATDKALTDSLTLATRHGVHIEIVRISPIWWTTRPAASACIPEISKFLILSVVSYICQLKFTFVRFLKAASMAVFRSLYKLM